ncbi:MAG: autotransporter outer membrane beta-barrel domain-containing protein [Burkholderiaceae bacterium]|nr:autotransporter outer membrane beta-barrel domain-containing protein [Burkholderiaceae bacterium]
MRALALTVLAAAAVNLLGIGAAQAACVNMDVSAPPPGNWVQGGIPIGTNQPIQDDEIVCSGTIDPVDQIIVHANKNRGGGGIGDTTGVAISLDSNTQRIGGAHFITIGSESTVTNDGTISTSDPDLDNRPYGISIRFRDSHDSVVTNNGTIQTKDAGADGLNIGIPINSNQQPLASSNHTLTNAGTISVSGDNASGIHVLKSTNVKVINSGIITATGANLGAGVMTNATVSAGVMIGDGSSGAFDNMGGTVSSRNGPGVDIQTSGVTVTNAAEISGGSAAIRFTQGGNTLILQTGSKLGGDAVTDVAGNGLRLRGQGEEDSNFVGSGAGDGFEQLVMEGADWRLAGNVTLVGTGPNTMDVTSGALRINGTADLVNGGGAIVESGATLGGNGTIKSAGGVEILNGGTLSPHVGTVTAGVQNTLTIDGDLKLNSGSILDYNFGARDIVGGSYNDLTHITGNLMLDGTINVHETVGGNFDLGIYRIFTYDGNLINNGLGVGQVPPPFVSGDFFVQTSINHQVNLVPMSSQGLLTYWDGANVALRNDSKVNGGSGSWQASSGNINWTDINGSLNAAWADEHFAVFGGTSGTVQVDNTPGPVLAMGMQFAANGYVIAGEDLTLIADGAAQSFIRVGDGTAAGTGYVATINAKLVGNTQLLKGGRGTLVLSNPDNAFTGGILVNAGTLRAGVADNAFKSANGPTTVAVTVANGGTLDLADLNQTIASLVNTGTVSLGPIPGTVLTVSENYTGGGVMALDAALGGGSSPTDKLVVNGDVTGTTQLRIANVGGLGAQTTGDGILVVQVRGNSPSNAFALENGAITVGSYTYNLVQVGTNWYLQSSPRGLPGASGVQAIPTLSGWSLALLMLTTIGAAGAGLLRRNRK